MKQEYLSYLESDHWRELKNRKSAEVGWRCQFCDGDHRIHGHHVNYRNYMDCTTEDILLLCEECHFYLHVALKDNGITNISAADTLLLLQAWLETPRGKAIFKRKQERKQKKLLRLAGTRPVHTPKMDLKHRKKRLKAAAKLCGQRQMTVEAIDVLIAWLRKEQALIQKPSEN